MNKDIDNRSRSGYAYPDAEAFLVENVDEKFDFLFEICSLT